MQGLKWLERSEYKLEVREGQNGKGKGRRKGKWQGRGQGKGGETKGRRRWVQEGERRVPLVSLLFHGISMGPLIIIIRQN